VTERPSGQGLEGYLFPDTYLLDRETSMPKLVDTMVRTFSQRLAPDLVRHARDKALTSTSW